MEKEFVTYEQALALKELGFDEPCLAFYDGKNTESFYFNYLRNASGDYIPFQKYDRLKWFGAPLKQQVFRWFRELHQLNCKIEFDKFITEDIDDNELEHPYFTYLYSINELWIEGKDFFKFQNGWNNITSKRELLSHEEAKEACIDKLIEIVKKQLVN